MASLKEVQKLGQSIWLDFISRDLITSGKLKKLVDDGLTGVTTNPAIFNKAIAQSADYDDSIRAVLRKNPGASAPQVCRALMVEDIQAAADILYPVFAGTNGMDGFISLEASPNLAYDTQGTLAEAKELLDHRRHPLLALRLGQVHGRLHKQHRPRGVVDHVAEPVVSALGGAELRALHARDLAHRRLDRQAVEDLAQEIGRASCRERV